MKKVVFISYAREDFAFALRLTADLKAKGANVWLDQLDIGPGRQCDRDVESALNSCTEMLVILSPAAVASNNVMDEVAFALHEKKTVIAVLSADCQLPSRIRRVRRSWPGTPLFVNRECFLHALPQDSRRTWI